MKILALTMSALLSIGVTAAGASETVAIDPSCRFDSPEWTKFERGRQLFLKEWPRSEGFGAIRYDPHVDHVTNSCSTCHNHPRGTAGSGGNSPGYGGLGRNTPDLFGVGNLEAISEYIRASIIAKYSSNGRFITKSALTGERILIEAMPGVVVDFGSLSQRSDGLLDVDPSLVVWFVDRDGKPLPPTDETGAHRDIGSPDVAGFDFFHGFPGWAASDHQYPTIRMFVLGVWKTIFGLPFTDALTRPISSGEVWAGRSVSGRRQLTIQSVEQAGNVTGPNSSDVDAIEHFLLNHPSPARRAATPEIQRGEMLMREMGCTSCHTPSWRVPAALDLRFAEWSVELDQSNNLSRVSIYKPVGEYHVFDGIFSDLRYHDLGDRFREYAWINDHLAVRTKFKTPPLWGVSSTAPYGHDGLSPTLDAVIRRHGGEADAAARSYEAASEADRDAVLRFLEGLVLFSINDALEFKCGSNASKARTRP
ncbi:di-heme oxidoredictase family protein [Bradyrhizobium sp. HKCCYLS1011]|uniref:di-heme oxidoredictase family protein n=1 Tax=Bradyrhizobium sp. HKCCYLS1011 TaxID=3420733 RepID=UPI003EBBE48B